MGTGSFLGVKRPGRGADYPPTSNTEVKEIIELYLYSPFCGFVALSRLNNVPKFIRWWKNSPHFIQSEGSFKSPNICQRENSLGEKNEAEENMVYKLWTMHFLHKKTTETWRHGVAMTYCVAERKRRGVWYIDTNAAESTASMFRRVNPKRS